MTKIGRVAIMYVVFAHGRVCDACCAYSLRFACGVFHEGKHHRVRLEGVLVEQDGKVVSRNDLHVRHFP